MFNSSKNPLIFCEFNQDNKGQTHFTWDTADNEYPMPDYSCKQNPGSGEKFNPRVKNILSQATKGHLVVTTVSPTETTAQVLGDFLKTTFMTNANIYNSVLEANPSVLNEKTAPLAYMPREIQLLYGYLENINLVNLPDFTPKPGQELDRDIYLGWRDFQFAVHHSLVTPFGYGPERRPIGIMNHLYKMRSDGHKKEYVPWTVKDASSYGTEKELLDYMYENREAYLRLELRSHEGLAPGSMAVLEVWPPYHCSILHNHGEAYGVIKCLSGDIRVQNFNELNFAALHEKKEDLPYQQMDYK
jgi:hypothetical protein